MSILNQLKDTSHFSDSEKQIITYLLNYPENIVNFTVRELAKVTYTSPATVTRLIHKLNNKQGFSHFKATFFREINNISTTALNESSTLSSSENAFSILQKVAAIENDTIDRTKNSIDYEQFSRLFYMMNQNSPIAFFGFDDNLHIAKIHLHALLSLGKHVVIHDESNAQYFQALTLDKHAVALLVSRTGENNRLVEIAEILKERNVPRIIFTPDKNSSLGKLSSEWVEVQNSFVSDTIGNIVFKTSIDYIFNCLCGLLNAKNHEHNLDIMKEYSKLFQKYKET